MKMGDVKALMKWNDHETKRAAFTTVYYFRCTCQFLTIYHFFFLKVAELAPRELQAFILLEICISIYMRESVDLDVNMAAECLIAMSKSSSESI